MATILASHASGMNLGQVAMNMYLSYSCVANTVQDIKRRLRARTLAQCVIIAHTRGYLSDPDDRGVVYATDPEAAESTTPQG